MRNFKEKNFQSLFNRWVRHRFIGAGVFELKVSSGTSLAFSAVKDHQVAGLYASQEGTCIHKISDEARSFSPFDSFCLRGVRGFVVIMFRCKEPKQNQFVMIPIDVWIKERGTSERKSITEQRALELGRVCELSSRK